MKFRVMTAACVLAAAGLLGLTPSAGAEPVSAGSAEAQKICGFWEDGKNAFYEHCGGTWVSIKIDSHAGYPGPRFRCVSPGLTWLGDKRIVANAYYVGLCG